MTGDGGPMDSARIFGDLGTAVAVCRGRLADGSMARADTVSMAADLIGAAIDLLRMSAEAASMAGSADADALDRGIELAEDAQQRMVSAMHLLIGAKALAEATR